LYTNCFSLENNKNNIFFPLYDKEQRILGEFLDTGLKSEFDKIVQESHTTTKSDLHETMIGMSEDTKSIEKMIHIFITIQDLLSLAMVPGGVLNENFPSIELPTQVVWQKSIEKESESKYPADEEKEEGKPEVDDSSKVDLVVREI
jgi:hypothetical protein